LTVFTRRSTAELLHHQRVSRSASLRVVQRRRLSRALALFHERTGSSPLTSSASLASSASPVETSSAWNRWPLTRKLLRLLSGVLGLLPRGLQLARSLLRPSSRGEG